MPNQPIESLDLFPTIPDRATYQQVTGVQAPIFDPAIGFVKLWSDPAASAVPPTALMTYTIFNGDQANPAMIPLVLSAAVAAKVNMPGRPGYAKYFVQPTAATAVFKIGGNTFPATIQPNTLSLKAQADALAALVGGVVEDAESRSVFQIDTWPADEPRRPWIVVYKDDTPSTPNWAYAGDLIADQNKAGIGAPGHWDTTGGHLAWVVDPIPDGGDKAYKNMAVPKRALAANETFQLVQIGGIGFQQVMVHTPDPQPPAVGGGDSPLLVKMAAQLQFIYNEMGGK